MNTTTAFPYVLQSSGSWYGNDGNWSTFQLNVGTPPQSFQVLPSSSGGETWLPVSEGCNFQGCAASRGVMIHDGAQSPGLLTNESSDSTWDQIGIYALSTDSNLFDSSSDSGLYGLDTISLGTQTSPNWTDQMVAGIATSDFWLGTLPLGIQPSQFDVLQKDVNSLLSSMKAQNMTPSLSYGYSVGASYRSQAASLVLGGYDKDAFEPNDVDFQVQYAVSRSLTASLESLVVTNSLNGTMSMPVGSTGLNMSIDSTVSQLWLPRSICDSMAQALGLTYDASTDLYLINSTSRSRLLDLNPEFTFTLAANSSSNTTTNIVLPYAAFDLQIGLPVYNSSVTYFPIRRAANESQQVLGRAFLQEAYLVVDWERLNFTMAQASHKSNDVSKSVMPILPPSKAQSHSGGLSAGAIAGIVVGVIVAVVLLCIAGWLWWRRRNSKKWAAATVKSSKASLGEQSLGEKDAKDSDGHHDGLTELASPTAAHDSQQAESRTKPGSELYGEERYELQDAEMRHQLMSAPVYELPGDTAEHELHARELQGFREDEAKK